MNRILGGRDMVKVAVAQISPVYLDKQKTIEKACGYIKEAGSNGAELVVFPEAFIPGYPAYFTMGYETDPHLWTDFMISLQDNALSIPGEDTEILGAAAREAGTYLVVGCNELDDRPGSRTVFNSLVYIGSDGRVLGKHRKLMPTYTERIYWGMGDGSDIRVIDTDIGRIGGLICWENHMPLVRSAMLYQGEDFHIAVWPGNWKRGSDKLLAPDTSPGGASCNLQSLIRVHAFEAGSFVLSACGYLDAEDFPAKWDNIKNGDHINYDWASGGSSIVNPAGRYLAEPCFEKDSLIYAECYANQIKAVKAVFDSLGHYSRWDIAKLDLNTSGLGPMTNTKAFNKLKNEDIARISDKYEIEPLQLENLLAEIAALLQNN